MQKVKHRPPQGFTLMELFITVFVLASTFAAFVTLFYALNSYSQKSYRLLVASDDAYAKLQEYEQREFAEVPIGDSAKSYRTEDFSGEVSDSIGGNRLASVYVTPVGDSPHIKKVDVIVAYQEGKDTRTVHYAAVLHATGGR